MNEPPRPGTWYENDEGRVLLVVTADPRAARIDIQHLDGSVDEWTYASWYEMELEEVEPPEEWRGSMDNFSRRRGK
jgi:hypothetical protein